MPKLNKNDIELVEENNEDFRLSVISRKNLTNEFTIESIEKHLRTLEKLKMIISEKNSLQLNWSRLLHL